MEIVGFNRDRRVYILQYLAQTAVRLQASPRARERLLRPGFHILAKAHRLPLRCAELSRAQVIGLFEVKMAVLGLRVCVVSLFFGTKQFTSRRNSHATSRMSRSPCLTPHTATREARTDRCINVCTYACMHICMNTYIQNVIPKATRSPPHLPPPDAGSAAVSGEMALKLSFLKLSDIRPLI